MPATNGVLVHDVARCLALAEQRRLVATAGGRWARKTLLILLEYTHSNSAWQPLRGEGPPWQVFLLGLLLQTGLLKCDADQIRTTPRADEWLALSLERQIAMLEEGWRGYPQIAWQWLPDAKIQGRAGSYWLWVFQLAMEEISSSTLTWGSLERMVPTLVAKATLSVSKQNWFRLPSARQSVETRTERMLWFLLTQVLPALGMVEVRREGWLLRRRESAGVFDKAASLGQLVALLQMEGVEPLSCGPPQTDPGDTLGTGLEIHGLTVRGRRTTAAFSPRSSHRRCLEPIACPFPA
jgi:hypothetical protein